MPFILLKISALAHIFMSASIFQALYLFIIGPCTSCNFSWVGPNSWMDWWQVVGQNRKPPSSPFVFLGPYYFCGHLLGWLKEDVHYAFDISSYAPFFPIISMAYLCPKAASTMEWIDAPILSTISHKVSETSLHGACGGLCRSPETMFTHELHSKHHRQLRIVVKWYIAHITILEQLNKLCGRLTAHNSRWCNRWSTMTRKWFWLGNPA